MFDITRNMMSMIPVHSIFSLNDTVRWGVLISGNILIIGLNMFRKIPANCVHFVLGLFFLFF
jgi:hypothetical protein